jgi:hypothetical protein
LYRLERANLIPFSLQDAVELQERLALLRAAGGMPAAEPVLRV